MSKKELKTIEGWQNSDCNSWGEYCKPGDLVDEGVVNYFLDIVPPLIIRTGYFQVGEPYSSAVNPKTMKSCETYATFLYIARGIWEYRGCCFQNELTDIERYKRYDSLKQFFQETYSMNFGMLQDTRPHVYCKDGFRMSVQAGDGLYCTPRANLENGEYETCEIGFPNQKEELLMLYAEDPEHPTATVYGYVPLKVVEAVIEKHGGWFDTRIPFV